MFDNQIRRNAREGYKAGDKFLFLSLLSGLLLVDSIRNKPRDIHRIHQTNL